MKPMVYASVNLTSKTVSNYTIPLKVCKKYLGGKILAAKLLLDLTPKGIDPLSEKAVVIINTGVANATAAPSSARFNMTFKNVLTGGIASSNCGGNFGINLKKAGYDGIILKGKASELSYIEIINGKIAIKSAEHLKNLDTEKTQQAFLKQYGKLVIGPAGEHLVKYACAVSQERVAGRCGSGAVLGAKNIKAIVAHGDKKIKAENPEKHTEYIKNWIQILKNHPTTGDTLPKYGTASIVNKTNSTNSLPSYNFTRGHFAKADNISGERLREKYLVKNYGCASCPIQCGRRIMIDGKEVKGPEYETLGLLGANIGNSDLEAINNINYQADLLGLDTISFAATIALAMELKQKGIKDFGLEFGKTDNIIPIMQKIAYREGEYSLLADGSKILSEKYNAQECAMHSKGLELSAYEPRRSVGMGLGYATSNRGGCHLNGGYLALFEIGGVIGMNPQATKGKAELTILMQNAMEACSAAGFCLFTMQALIPNVLFKWNKDSLINKAVGAVLLSSGGIFKIVFNTLPYSLPFSSIYLIPHCKDIEYITGIKMTTGQFLQLGERGFNLERLYNLREGLTALDDTLPTRLTQENQVKKDDLTKVNLAKMLPKYYLLRGWDKNGVPTDKKLKKLGLSR